MRLLIFIFLFLFSFKTEFFAQTKIEQQLERIERQRFEAMVSKDIASLENVLSDDLTYIHSNGLFETKTDHLQNIQSGKLVYKSMQPEGGKVRVYGKSAVITGIVKVTGVLNEKEFEIRLRYTDVYVKQKGRWHLAAWQSVKAEP